MRAPRSKAGGSGSGSGAAAGRRPPRRAEAIDAPAGKSIPLTTSVLFEVLADATRRRLLVQLLDEREMGVNWMVEALQLSQPKVSHHLAALRAAGVLVCRRQWRQQLYRYHPALPAWAVRAIAMMSDAARQEPAYRIDRSRLASAKRCDGIAFP